MKRVGYVYDPFMTLHEHPMTYKLYEHPERPKRIHHIYRELLNRDLINKMRPIKSRLVTKNELLLCHSNEYLTELSDIFDDPKKILNIGEVYDDIFANEHSMDCALLSAGSTINLVDSIVFGIIDRGVAIVRPPGHHAETDKAMGFCYFNNIALAAKKARDHGKRVVVVDFDIHFGNGTQNILMDQNNLFFFSIHRYDSGKFYPGSGHESTHKNIFNFPLNFTDGNDEEYIKVFSEYFIPKIKLIKPGLILVSAGFDAAEGDPLGGYNVTPEGYKTLVQLMLQVQSNLALVLEGGYNLTSISKSMASCVEALLEF